MIINRSTEDLQQSRAHQDELETADPKVKKNEKNFNILQLAGPKDETWAEFTTIEVVVYREYTKCSVEQNRLT